MQVAPCAKIVQRRYGLSRLLAAAVQGGKAKQIAFSPRFVPFVQIGSDRLGTSTLKPTCRSVGYHCGELPRRSPRRRIGLGWIAGSGNQLKSAFDALQGLWCKLDEIAPTIVAIG